MSIGVGADNDLHKMFDAGRIFVKNKFLHPQYNQTENDIALLELESPIQFTRYIQPTCIQTSKRASYGLLNTAGFGRVNKLEIDRLTGKPLSKSIKRFLKEIDLRDVSASTKKCKENPNLICADSITEGDSSCTG